MSDAESTRFPERGKKQKATGTRERAESPSAGTKRSRQIRPGLARAETEIRNPKSPLRVARSVYWLEAFWSSLVHATVPSAHKLRKKICMHEVLNEIYLQNLFRNGYIFS